MMARLFIVLLLGSLAAGCDRKPPVPAKVTSCVVDEGRSVSVPEVASALLPVFVPIESPPAVMVMLPEVEATSMLLACW